MLTSLQDLIRAQAGNPSAVESSTPGMLTPKELSANYSGEESPTGGQRTPHERERNPFGDFSSITRQFGDV